MKHRLDVLLVQRGLAASRERASALVLSGVVIVNAPIVHVSGVFRVVQAMLDGRRIALLERFTVDGWTAAEGRVGAGV